MYLKVFALAVVLSALATVRAQEPAPTPPAEVAPSAAPPRVVASPGWLERPSGEHFNRFYPARARAEHVDGAVTVDCIVGADGLLACTVVSEDPEGWGFGEAALQVSQYFRMVPQIEDGTPTAGGRYRTRLRFALQD